MEEKYDYESNTEISAWQVRDISLSWLQ